MEHRRMNTSCGMGKLPAKAPLANPYVPFQMTGPKQYEPRMGLVRGTIYQGLDLPFMGMVNRKEQPVTPKTELQTLGFMVQELALYLDTHPDDMVALEQYRQYQKLYHDGMMRYSEDCRPLAHTQPVNDKTYSWLRDPWPWEYAANKEG